MKTWEDIKRDSLAAEVATVNGKSVTRGELMRYFNMVAPVDNWKYPIDAEVELEASELAMLEEAVVFFSGSRAKVTILLGAAPGKNKYRIEAAGYYAAVGA